MSSYNNVAYNRRKSSTIKGYSKSYTITSRPRFKKNDEMISMGNLFLIIFIFLGIAFLYTLFGQYVMSSY